MANPIKHKQLVEAGNPFAEAITGAKALVKEMAKLQEQAKTQIKFSIKGLESQAANTKGGQMGIGVSAKDLDAQTKLYTTLAKKYTEAKQSLGQLSQAQQKYMQMSEQERVTLTKQIAVLQQKQAIERAQARIDATNVGSIQRQRAELSKLQLLWNNAKIGSKEWENYGKQITKSTAELTKHEAKLGQHQRNVGNYGSIIGKFQAAWVGVAAGIGAVVAAGAGVISFFKEAITHAVAEEKSNARLQLALGKNVGAYDRIVQFKKKMLATTTFTKDEINDALNYALSLGRTETEAKKALIASMGLAKATDGDLGGAMAKVQATYNGVTRGMGRYSSAITTMTKEQLTAGGAIDELSNKLGKFATSGLDTTAGKMAMAKKSFVEFQEAIGFLFLPVLSKLMDGITGVANMFKGWFELPVSEELGKEQSSINVLVGSITGLNEKSELRKKLLDELATKYPQYFGNIDKEKIKNSELITILKGVNSEYDKRIKLAVFGEDVAKLQKEGTDIFKKQRDNLGAINLLYEQVIKNKKLDATTEEKIAAIKARTSGAFANVSNATDINKATLDLEREFVKLKIEEVINRNKANQVSADQLAYEKKITAEKRAQGTLSADELIALKESGAILTAKEQATITAYAKTETAKISMSQKTTEELQKLVQDGIDGNATKTDIALGKAAERELAKREHLNKQLSDSELENKIKIIETTAELVNGEREKELAKIQASYEVEMLKFKGNETQKLEYQKVMLKKRDVLIKDTNDKFDRETDKRAKDTRKQQIDVERSLWEARIGEFTKFQPQYYDLSKQLLEQEMRWEIEQTTGTTAQKMLIWIAYLQKLGNLKKQEAKNLEIKNKPEESGDFATRAGAKKPEFETPSTTGAIGTLAKDAFDLSGIKARREALQAERDKEIADAKGDTDKINKIWQDYYKADADLAKEAAQTKAQLLSDFVGAVQQALGMVSQYYSQQKDKEMSEVDEKYTAEKESLDNQLAHKQISQKTYDAKMLALDKKKKDDELAIEKAYKKKQKNIAIIQAIINTAVGVTGSLAQGGILGIVMAAITLALGIAEIALISSQTFKKGGHGILNKYKGGVLQGKRHEQGGVSLGDVGTAEQGEYFAVLNRDATNKYKGILPLIFDALNQQKFDSMFSPKDVNVNMTGENKYDRLIYETLSKPKIKTDTIVTEKYIIRKTGNYTEKILK